MIISAYADYARAEVTSLTAPAFHPSAAVQGYLHSCPSPAAAQRVLQLITFSKNDKKDRKLTLAVCVGVTYLPGPSPAKYCQHM